jgi:hypothetical protein
MEFIKAKKDFLQPDPCSIASGPTLDQQYEMLEYFELHEGVPEHIRSYMASVVTLWLYGCVLCPGRLHEHNRS